MQERAEHQRQSLVADNQSPECAVPGDGALDDPSMAVSAERPSILGCGTPAIAAVRSDQFDPATPQSSPQGVTVVSLVRDQSVRSGPRSPGSAPRDGDRLERCRDERDLCRRGRGGGNSQRKTLAVDHHHELCALAPLGFPDFGPPFFAGLNVPSMNVSSQRSRPRASSFDRYARQMRNQTPSSSQRRRRRQQVAGLGYSSGRSRQRAPVFNTQRMPSNTERWPIHGRPPRGRAGRGGSSGSSRRHCFSVRRTLARATRVSLRGAVEPMNPSPAHLSRLPGL